MKHTGQTVRTVIDSFFAALVFKKAAVIFHSKKSLSAPAIILAKSSPNNKSIV